MKLNLPNKAEPKVRKNPKEPKKEARPDSRAPTSIPVQERRELANRIPNIIKTLSELLTDDDMGAVAKVYRDALEAEGRIWVKDGGPGEGHWEYGPDWRTRLEAAKMIAAYKEGLPVQRQVVLTAKFAGAEEALARFQQSPEALRAISSVEEIQPDGS